MSTPLRPKRTRRRKAVNPPPFTAREFPPVLTRAEAALFLRLGLRTVDRLIAEGRLPVRRQGSRVLIVRDEALAALEGAGAPTGRAAEGNR